VLRGSGACWELRKTQPADVDDRIYVDVLLAHGKIDTIIIKLLSPEMLELMHHLQFRADFFFKVDDDVIVNVPALVAYLEPRRQRGNLYMVRAASHIAQGCC